MRPVNNAVRERERAGSHGPRRAPFVLLVLGLIGTGLFALLAINTAAAADEVRQRELSSTNADTLDETQQLKIDIANKQAPAALASAARALGMVPNPNPAFLVVRSDGAVAVVGSPVRASGKPVATATATLAPASPVTSPGAPATSTSTVAAGSPSGAAATPTATPVVTPTTVTISGAR
jgi:hypothetical protein